MCGRLGIPLAKRISPPRQDLSINVQILLNPTEQADKVKYSTYCTGYRGKKYISVLLIVGMRHRLKRTARSQNCTIKVIGTEIRNLPLSYTLATCIKVPYIISYQISGSILFCCRSTFYGVGHSNIQYTTTTREIQGCFIISHIPATSSQTDTCIPAAYVSHKQSSKPMFSPPPSQYTGS